MADDEICLFCLKPIEIGQFVALSKVYARQLLGASPPRRSKVKAPKGTMWVAHVACARAAEKEVCVFCGEGILWGEQVAGLPETYVRRLLGGAEPDERSRSTDPRGRPCVVAHGTCATEAGVDLDQAER
ncbi:hypothetical protein [Amycolatopsis suaedae]|uniref:Uncharacterized protein n=1 Tax=Amycolatopsis suaedae TaxID=2510978 RepID=A0A4Q7J3Y2_9PSEU|nr:hypothetical protein [Amycolatopsis suaedae]RZQ61709.1 hypothetical protein EWH70_22390 [Amycolatopsis suaedae]